MRSLHFHVSNLNNIYVTLLFFLSYLSFLFKYLLLISFANFLCVFNFLAHLIIRKCLISKYPTKFSP